MSLARTRIPSTQSKQSKNTFLHRLLYRKRSSIELTRPRAKTTLHGETSSGTVGDGECWTLVQNALQDLAEAYRLHGKEPTLISQGRSHGSRILALTAGAPGSNEGLLQLADARRGDVLKIKAAHFRTVKAAPAERVEWGRWQKGALR